MLRPRFSLVTLLLLTALIAGGVAAWLAYEHRDRTAEALQLIEEDSDLRFNFSTMNGKTCLELSANRNVEFVRFQKLAKLLNRSVFRQVKLYIDNPRGDWPNNPLTVPHQLELAFTGDQVPPLLLNGYLNQYVSELKLTTISFLLDTSQDPAPELRKLHVTNCDIELQGKGVCFAKVEHLEFDFDGKLKGGTRAQLCGSQPILEHVSFFHVDQLASDPSLGANLASRKMIKELKFDPIRPGCVKLLEALEASACRVLEIYQRESNAPSDYPEDKAKAEEIMQRIMDRSKN